MIELRVLGGHYEPRVDEVNPEWLGWLWCVQGGHGELMVAAVIQDDFGEPMVTMVGSGWSDS